MVNQAALDTLLTKADQDCQGRFVEILAADDIPTQAVIEPDEDQTSSGEYVKHPGDGKLMARIAEGIFLSGEDDAPLWVDEFHIDAFPTTNADYARFCAAARQPAPEHWQGGRCPRELYDHPVVHVTWRDANAYATWAGEVASDCRTVGEGRAGHHRPDLPVGGPEDRCKVQRPGVRSGGHDVCLSVPQRRFTVRGLRHDGECVGMAGDSDHFR